MILPPFDPPSLDELTRFWRRCTYADVHRLVLEVLHLRLAMLELAGDAYDVDQAAKDLPPEKAFRAKPARRIRRLVDAELQRAGPLENGRDRVAPFSGEWLAREATKSRLYDAPDPAGADDLAAVTRLPRFQRASRSDLRKAWRTTPRGRGTNFTLGQRLILETIKGREIMRNIEKFAQRARRDLAAKGIESAELDDLLRALLVEIEERGQ